MSSSIPYRAGQIGLMGRPNVGKSTLLNQLLGEKLAIVAPRPQTTRNRILGVCNLDGAQLVLVDTPGLHRPSGKKRTRLNTFMVEEAKAALVDVDVVVVVEDATDAQPNGPAWKYLMEELETLKKPKILALNKVDLIGKKLRLLPLMERFAPSFAAVVPLSAKNGQGVDGLIEEIRRQLPEGPPLYPPETLTDRHERFLAAELVREQVFQRVRQEVPYAVAVSIDRWSEGDNGVSIAATVLVEKTAQKKILVGRAGQMVKEIGMNARAEIGKMLDRTVHLQLFVRVDPNWTDRPEKLRELGYAK
jgi:GTP-binding protein Era